jgi:hypothetical protein
MPFLVSRDPRPLTGAPAGLSPQGLFLGNGNQALEVALFSASAEPTRPLLRDALVKRIGQRATPVVVVVEWGADRASFATRVGEEIVVHSDLERGQVERLCEGALSAPDRHGAQRFLSMVAGQLEAPIPGLRNEGLFALHELASGVRSRRDWAEASGRAARALGLRGRTLIQQLGFGIQAMPGPASVLVAKQSKRAVAVFLDRPDEIEVASQHYDNVSPITYALAKADQENLEFVVVAAGPSLRVYPVKPGVGTGRRGRTETYVELQLAVLAPDNAAYLWLLASADALASGGTFEAILARSTDYAVELGARLRDRVYAEVIPPLANALVRAQRLRNPSSERLHETYEMALLVLFRLLFVAYAEDKDLLPLHSNAQYREHSLKRIAQRLLDDERRDVRYGREAFLWTEVQQLWRAVDRGNSAWGVPIYNGGLFANSEEDGGTPAAARLAGLSLPDDAFAPALRALMVDATADGARGPVDFRSLGVREFGTVYEGLLESELSVAQQDLALDRKGAYVPAGPKDAVVVVEGAVYLHNASGARKATGSYYTKSFAVEHLLDRALEPALDSHLKRLDALSDRDASDQFFDFRVADIAMGSAHFLVAAVDRIERRFSNYLSGRMLPGVRDELERLRAAAREALGEDWGGEPIEDTQLLRRQIARRCVYGVDLNPTAVELARLSLWIHTFVPGLPLSFLNRNLRVGNALVGIATLDEARDLLVEEGDLFALSAEDLLSQAQKPLDAMAKIAEATAAEVRQAKKHAETAAAAMHNTENLFTVLAASRIDDDIAQAVASKQISTRALRAGDLFTDGLVRKAERALGGLSVFHFPTAFPEVFLRKRAGFDVLLGNPPWETAVVRVDGFWARHFPGLRSMPQRDQVRLQRQYRDERPDLAEKLDQDVADAAALRQVLTSGPFPGMGSGDPDLFKAFCWRFWHLCAANNGRVGVVLPRSAFASSGSMQFRQTIFSECAEIDVTMLTNNRQWIFDEVHPQYTVGLVTLTRAVPGTARADAPASASVVLRGPYRDLERLVASSEAGSPVFSGKEIAEWTDTAAFPLLPSDESALVFAQLRRAPRLDLNVAGNWRARPYRELDATNDKPLMDVEATKPPRGFWPVYKGESFEHWNPDTGTYYAYADPKVVLPVLVESRTKGARNKRSVFSEMSPDQLGGERTLACFSPRLAVRAIGRATDTRTIIPSLLPPKVFLAHHAPYFEWPRGDAHDVTYLLGVLSSLPLDWYARRFVEVNISYFIVNPLPVPRPGRDHPLWQRVVALAGRLASPDDRFAGWAATLGVAAGPLSPDEKADMIQELDAVVARLYGLSESQLVHVFETFHEGWDYEDRLRATLRHFGRLATQD